MVVTSGARQREPRISGYRLWGFLLLLALLIVGCGSSQDGFLAGQSPSPAASTGTIRLQQVLVPDSVTTQRFTGFDDSGAVRFGPFTTDKAAVIELSGVSTAVTRLQIEYLEGQTVVGLGSVVVSVRAGETTVVDNPPFDDVTAALLSLQITPRAVTVASGSQ